MSNSYLVWHALIPLQLTLSLPEVLPWQVKSLKSKIRKGLGVKELIPLNISRLFSSAAFLACSFTYRYIEVNYIQLLHTFTSGGKTHHWNSTTSDKATILSDINPFSARPAKTVHFVILLCLTLYDFTCRGRASGWERVNTLRSDEL